jgi:hypothetical protein
MNDAWIDPPRKVYDVAPRIPYAGAAAWSITFGALVVGLLLAAIGTRALPIPQLEGGPIWALGLFGAIATLTGLVLLGKLIETARRRRRCRNETLAWRRDYDWGHGRVVNGTTGGWRRRSACALHLECMPLLPGSSTTARLIVNESSADLVLRGLHETAFWNRVGTNAPKVRTSLFFLQNLGTFQIRGGQVDFTLAIPAEAPASHLYDPPITYWELLVIGASGRRYVILLPVYGAP